MSNVSLDPVRLVRVTAGSGDAVTPSDTADLVFAAQAGLYTITAGNLSFKDSAGTTHALLAVPAFTRIPIVATRVLATGTVASVLALN